MSEEIECMVRVIRGQKVMLDRDLAALYGVETRTLNQAVRRNIERFPEDFMFQLSQQEAECSRSQFVILKRGSNVKYLPNAFTEQGVAMLSTVLRSPQAIKVNIEIMRTFVRLRRSLFVNDKLSKKVADIESFMLKFSSENRLELRRIWKAIGELQKPSEPERKIGFRLE